MAKHLLPDPALYISGYRLKLYCKFYNSQHEFKEFPHVFSGEHGPDVFREARRKGWLIHKDHTAACPKCATPRKKDKRI